MIDVSHIRRDQCYTLAYPMSVYGRFLIDTEAAQFGREVTDGLRVLGVTPGEYFLLAADLPERH